jgi:hypothetical protein
MTKQKRKRAAAVTQVTEKTAWKKNIEKEIAECKRSIAAIRRFPKVEEMAQLTVGLKQASRDADIEELVIEAGDVWVECRDAVRHRLTWEVEDLEEKLAAGMWGGEVDDKPVMELRDGKSVIKFVDGKADFEEVLKALIGATTRKAERYRLFREFQRDQIKKRSTHMDEAEIDAAADKRFFELKAQGFTPVSYLEEIRLFGPWRKERLSERGRKGAEGLKEKRKSNPPQK